MSTNFKNTDHNLGTGANLSEQEILRQRVNRIVSIFDFEPKNKVNGLDASAVAHRSLGIQETDISFKGLTPKAMVQRSLARFTPHVTQVPKARKPFAGFSVRSVARDSVGIKANPLKVPVLADKNAPKVNKNSLTNVVRRSIGGLQLLPEDKKPRSLKEISRTSVGLR